MSGEDPSTSSTPDEQTPGTFKASPSPFASPISPGPGSPGRQNIDFLGSTFTKAANEFAAERDELERDIRSILDAVDASGSFAGTDETANTFRTNYSTALDNVRTYVNALRDVYPEVAVRLAATKTTLDIANWAIIESLPKVPDPPTFSGSDGKLTP